MTTAPRVEACIEAVMAKYPRTGSVSQAEYYEEVHQHLGPLARDLERELVTAESRLALMHGIHEQIMQHIEVMRKDTERFDWLTRKIAGSTFRKLGIEYGEFSQLRSAIDAEMEKDRG